MLENLINNVDIDSGNGLVPSAITWANVDLDLCRCMASLGHSESISLSYLTETEATFVNCEYD